jgi:hypothetical protein
VASDHTGDADEFYSVVSMLDGSDVMSATQLLTIYERIHDNTCHVKRVSDMSLARLAARLDQHPGTVFADTGNGLAVIPYECDENHPGPVIAIKVGEAFAIFDQAVTAVGGAVPNLTSIVQAAVSLTGRAVVVGATTPFCAFRATAGSWTGGGAEIGGTPSDVIYSPVANKFFACRTGSVSVYNSSDALAWTAVAAYVGAPGIQALACVGAGAGAGTIVELGTTTLPTIAASYDNGATWGFSGTGIPNRLTADESGSLAGCPSVTRNGLNEYLYHVFRADSGARLRLSRTTDGITWESGPTITAPQGHAFASRPRLLICKTTGLMFIIAPAQRTAESLNVTAIYTSLDWVQWRLADVQGTRQITSYGAANGRLYQSNTAALMLSTGIASEVYE